MTAHTHTLHSRRYKGHKNSDYKLDSSLSHDDAHVVSGSEDGRICFWDLVEVQLQFMVFVCVFYEVRREYVALPPLVLTS